MSKCPRCDGRGFLEYETRRDAKFYVQLSKCCDDAKYAAEVKRRHAPPAPTLEVVEPKVLAFRGKE